MKLKKKIGLGVLSLATVLGSTAAMLSNDTSSVNAAAIPTEGIVTTITTNEDALYYCESLDRYMQLYSSGSTYSMFYWYSDNSTAMFYGKGTLSVSDTGENKIVFDSYFGTNGNYVEEDKFRGDHTIVIYEDKVVDVTFANSEFVKIDKPAYTESDLANAKQEGIESVDITSNDKEIYDKGFADGVTSIKDVVVDHVEEEKENWFVSTMKWINTHLFFGLFGN